MIVCVSLEMSCDGGLGAVDGANTAESYRRHVYVQNLQIYNHNNT